MHIEVDEKGFVKSYALFGGTFKDDVEVEEPDNIEHFEENYSAYYRKNGKLIFDETKAEADALERQKQAIRYHREQICFPIINRGEAWYRSLTTEQYEELSEWYKAWLDATETLKEPEMLSWL